MYETWLQECWAPTGEPTEEVSERAELVMSGNKGQSGWLSV